MGALAATESSWHYKRHNNNNVSLSHQKRASRLHRDYEEQEENLSESFSESDLNQMMMKSVAMDRRHHASRAAVHPIAISVLALLASIPAMLGWLLLLPVTFTSLFVCYNSIFPEKADTAPLEMD